MHTTSTSPTFPPPRTPAVLDRDGFSVIDITEEVRAIRGSPAETKPEPIP